MSKFNRNDVLSLILIIALIMGSIYIPNVQYFLLIFILISCFYYIRNADKMTKLDKGHPKVNTYKFLVLFDISIIISFFIIHFYEENILISSRDLASLEHLKFTFILIFVLISGNLAPKIPFNRTVGLRLPWTVRDKSTWNYAHRLLGYCTIPCALLIFISERTLNDHCLIIALCFWIGIPSVCSLYRYVKGKGPFVDSSQI